MVHANDSIYHSTHPLQVSIFETNITLMTVSDSRQLMLSLAIEADGPIDLERRELPDYVPGMIVLPQC